MAALLTGGCGCGAVRFEISEPFASANYCHCTRCQRRTGTAASANGRTVPGVVPARLGRGAPALVGARGRRREDLLRPLRLGRLQPRCRRSADDRRPPRRARRRPRHRGRSGASTSPTPRAGRRSRTTACRGTPKAGRNARSRAPSSSGFIGGRSRRRLRSGETAAPERESLALLPSGPDAVRMLPVRGTRPSTPRARDLIPLKPPSDGVRSRWSGCRVQGTANSPPSATGREGA